MAFQRTACICFCVVVSSSIAYGQRQSDTAGDVAPQRRVYTQAESGGRTASQLATETRSLAPDVRRTDRTLLLLGINERLRETVREESTARQVSPEVVRHEGTQLVRDINGRWKPVEIWRGEVRQTGAERVEEETIHRPDLNGNLELQEVNVIRSSSTKGHEQVVIETHAPQTDVISLNGRPPLSTRVRRTTTATADGGSYTVEEVEARSRVSPNDPMRVVRRTVTTVSPGGRDEWVTERQIFEVDPNGRLVRIE